MTNNEVFARYGKESWIIEHQLVSLLQRYKEEGKNVNLVAFVKNFKNRTDFIDVTYTEGDNVDNQS